jgi:ribosomal protein S6--L-glutamate ligase
MEHVVLDLERGTARFGDLDLASLDGLVIKKIGKPYSADLLDRLAMLRFVRGNGLPVYSDPFAIKRVLDRLSCTVTLRLENIPMPSTVITEQVDHAVDAVHQFGKAVLKPLYSTKARGMQVIESSPDTREQIMAFQSDGNPVLYVQKMLDLPGRDLGVAFLGGEFLGCYARTGSKESWNTTVRAGGRYQPFEPTPEILALAQRAQDLFDLSFTCVDIAETEKGLVVFEVSAFGGFRGLLEANQIDAASLYADYVLARLNGS